MLCQVTYHRWIRYEGPRVSCQLFVSNTENTIISWLAVHLSINDSPLNRSNFWDNSAPTFVFVSSLFFLLGCTSCEETKNELHKWHYKTIKQLLTTTNQVKERKRNILTSSTRLDSAFRLFSGYDKGKRQACFKGSRPSESIKTSIYSTTFLRSCLMKETILLSRKTFLLGCLRET